MPYKSSITKHEVLEAIRDKILFLDYKPGEVLSDVKLAEELNVSRTPIREALLILKIENLIDIFPQSGTFVSLIDLDLIREIVYMRHILECEVMMKLFREKVEIGRHLERYIILQNLAVIEKNQKEYVKNDHMFHREIFNLAGHERAWELVENMYKHTIRFHILDFYDSNVFGTSLEEHKKIIEYYEKGDEYELRKMLDIHHDCKLRTSENLKAKFPGYFK